MTMSMDILRKALLGVVLLVFATLLNCGLIMMGTPGLFLTLALMAALCLWSYSFDFGFALDRCLLAIAVACFYISSIWYPDLLAVLVSGAALAVELLRFPRRDLALYLSVAVLYVLSADIAFYFMGDPVLEWSDAALVLTAVVIPVMGLYIDYQEKRSA